jgi:hypothetical protein
LNTEDLDKTRHEFPEIFSEFFMNAFNRLKRAVKQKNKVTNAVKLKNQVDQGQTTFGGLGGLFNKGLRNVSNANDQQL